MTRSREPLLFPHGGYRRLKSFALAQLIYDVTVRFCDCYVPRRSRTHDQMVQAARSGVQNIAEGSQASGTSKKIELKLTNIARASLEELRLDYEDFLRQRNLRPWPPDHPALLRFKAHRCANLEDIRDWLSKEQTYPHSTATPTPVIIANATLTLLNLCCRFLDRQVESQARAFEQEGGFTERLYHHRRSSRGSAR